MADAPTSEIVALADKIAPLTIGAMYLAAGKPYTAPCTIANALEAHLRAAHSSIRYGVGREVVAESEDRILAAEDPDYYEQMKHESTAADLNVLAMLGKGAVQAFGTAAGLANGGTLPAEVETAIVEAGVGLWNVLKMLYGKAWTKMPAGRPEEEIEREFADALDALVSDVEHDVAVYGRWSPPPPI
jgi:hypothetical protein